MLHVLLSLQSLFHLFTLLSVITSVIYTLYISFLCMNIRSIKALSFICSANVRSRYSLGIKQFSGGSGGTHGSLCTVIMSEAQMGLCTINSFPTWFLSSSAACLRY